MDTLNAIAYNNAKIREWVESLLEGKNLKRVDVVNNFKPYTDDDEDVLYLVTDRGGTKFIGFSYNGLEKRDVEVDLSDLVKVGELGGYIDSWMGKHFPDIVAHIPDVTTESSGLMTPQDKAKLDAQRNYVHPTYQIYPLDSYQIETDGEGHVVRAVPIREHHGDFVKEWDFDIDKDLDQSYNPNFDGGMIKIRLVFLDEVVIRGARQYGIGTVALWDYNDNLISPDILAAQDGEIMLSAEKEYYLMVDVSGYYTISHLEITFSR